MVCPLNPLDCPVIGPVVDTVVGGAANAAGNAFAETIRDGAKWVMRTSVGWWLNVDSIDIASSPASQIRQDVFYISLVVATIGLIWCGIRLCIRKKSEPLWDIGTGLVRLVLVYGLAFIVPQMLLDAGDSFSTYVFNNSVSDSVAERFVQMAGMAGIAANGAVIFFGIILIFAGLIQAVLMFLREGGIVILSGVLILAASGGFNPATRSWFPKVSGWLLGLIFYKPFAALVYAAAFHFIGSDDSPRNVFIGITMIILAIVALPVMVKFFSWAAPAASNGGGLGGAAAALAGAGLAAAALRGRGSGGGGGGGSGGAAEQARHIQADLGPAGGSSGGSSSGAASSAPSGARTGSATAGAASSASAAASKVAPAAAALLAAVQAAGVAKNAVAHGMTGGGE